MHNAALESAVQSGRSTWQEAERNNSELRFLLLLLRLVILLPPSWAVCGRVALHAELRDHIGTFRCASAAVPRLRNVLAISLAASSLT